MRLTEKTFNVEMTMEELEMLEELLWIRSSDLRIEMGECSGMEDKDLYESLNQDLKSILKFKKDLGKILKAERGCK